MARQQQDDELFEIKNYFYIGNYQQCINEAHKLRNPSSAEVAVQRDIFTYKSYIALNKYLVVLEEIRNDAPQEIQALKLLAEYLSSKSKRESILNQIEQKLNQKVENINTTLIIVAATMYIRENNYDAAYRVLHTMEDLETMSFVVSILLKIHRVDLARKKLKEMQDKDDDATITQLTQAWVNIASGGDKLQDAYYIYQELIDKYGATSLLLNGQAVSLISQRKYKEAELPLQDALNRDNNYPDTLINFVCLNGCLRKSSDISKRYLSELKDAHPDHEFLKDLNQLEADFDNICLQYSPSVTNIPV